MVHPGKSRIISLQFRKAIYDAHACGKVDVALQATHTRRSGCSASLEQKGNVGSGAVKPQGREY